MSFKKQYLLPIFIIASLLIFAYYKFFILSDEVNTSSTLNLEEVEYPEVNYSDVILDGDTVLYNSSIYITEGGTYEFSGDYIGTLITVDTDDIVYIVLNNANITSTTDSLINVLAADSVVVNAVSGTVNYLTQNYSSNSEDVSGAVIYSKSDLVVNGTGEIIINTNYNDGINGRDDVIIENVIIEIDAAADGIVGNDNLAITNAIITINSLKDGLKASNSVNDGNILIESGTFSIDSIGDAISAEGTLQINNGDFKLTTNGGYIGILKEITLGEGSSGVQVVTDYSSKALKAYNIIIQNGNFNISSYEDAIHADNDLYVKSGYFEIYAGDDGVHADNVIVIDYALLYIKAAYEGIEANNITINDGVIDAVVYDDAINNSSETGILTINGGEIYLYSNGDGIDSNGDLLITGGSIVIENDAIYTGGDYEIDVNGSITVTGGTIVDENGNEIDYENVMNSHSNQMMVPGRR